MKYKVLVLTTITLFSTFVAGNAKNILSLKESITDNAIVYPSSFETDTKEMMENWYLKNYAIIDQSNIENRNYGEVSDAEYIKRLKALPTVIEMPFNQIVKSYIERYVKRSRTLVAQMLGMSPYYMPIFEDALERHQMPLELKYIPIIESALNPNAVSPAGAGGLWQFMVATGKGLGLEVNSLVDERRDPYRSSEKAAVYFKQLYNTYHDWSLAIAAYNCGPGNVNKAIRRTGTENPDFWEIYNYLPKETRGYVPAFIAANYVMAYYKEHNISPTLTKKPLIIDTVQVRNRIYFSQISQVLNIPLDEIRILNPQYRSDVIPGNSSKSYSLALPSQQIYSYIMAEDKITNYHRKQFDPREIVQPGDVKSIIDDERDNMASNGIEYHEVTDDEDFIDIADRYGMQYDDLMELNNLSSTTLHKGQVLKVVRKGYNVETVMGGMAESNQQPTYASNNMPSNNNYNNSNSYRNSQQGSGHYDGDSRYVPERSQRNQQPAGQQNVPVPQRNNNSSNSNNYNSNKQSNYDESLRRQQEEEAAAKRRADEAARKKRQEELAKKKAAEEAAAKKRRDEAAKKKRQEEAAKKKAAEEAARKKAEEERRRREAEKPIKHAVKEGDNLTRLAERNGVSIEDIKRANGLKDDNIRIGETILIPKKDSRGRVIMPNGQNERQEHKSSSRQQHAKQDSAKNERRSSKRSQEPAKKQEQPKESKSSKSSSKSNNTVQPKSSSKKR